MARYQVSASIDIVAHVDAHDEESAEAADDSAIARAWVALSAVDLSPFGASITGRYDDTDVDRETHPQVPPTSQ